MNTSSSSLDLRSLFMQKLSSNNNASSSKHVHTGVYTGVMEKYEEASEQLVLMINHKGKPVAIVANQQILPFEVVTVSDAMAKGYGEDYGKNRQGRLLLVKGERPKGR